jgi:GR25 family glycosyltransferase involved in LPS biosynthesis
MASFCVASTTGREGCERFRAANPGFPVTHGFVQDPTTIDRESLLAAGLITPDNAYIPFAMAQALAHVAVWRHCAESGDVAHVAEDRAILRGDFRTAIAPHLADPARFDILVWGFDFADPARIAFAPGVEGRLIHDQTRTPPDFPAFRASQVPTARFRLLYCATACGYTLTPAGARKLLDRCIPMGGGTLPYFGETNRVFANSGIDREMARHYPNLDAFILQPVLAVLPQGGAPRMTTEHFLNAFSRLAGQRLLNIPPGAVA